MQKMHGEKLFLNIPKVEINPVDGADNLLNNR